MQIETKYYPTPVRMAIIKKPTNKCWQDVEKRGLSCFIGGTANWAATMENSMGVPQKLKNRISIPPLLGIYTKKSKTLIWKDIRIPMFIEILFTIAKILSKHSLIDNWKKRWYIYIVEFDLAIKKEWNLTIWDNMDEPRRYYAKWNKSENEKYHIISFLCGI